MPVVEALSAIFRAFAHPRAEGAVLILGFLVPVFAISAVILVRVYLRLVEERRLLAQCRSALDRARQAEDDVDADDIAAWVADAHDDSPVKHVVQSLWSARRLATPDLEALATMLGQKESGRLSFPRAVPNILLLGGLLGTVVGLAAVVGSLAPYVNKLTDSAAQAGIEQLASHLIDTLRQMQNAFACTLWGIFLAVVTALATRSVSHTQSVLIGDVLEFGFGQFVPSVFPRSQEAQLQDIQQVLRASRAFLGRLPATMERAAGDFERVLQGAGAAMQASLDRLQSVSTSMQEALVAVATQVKSGAEGLNASVVAVKESADRLNNYHQQLAMAYGDLRQLFDESQAKLDEQAKGLLGSIGGLQARFEESAGRVLAGTQDVSTRLQESVGAFLGAGNAFREVGAEVTGRLDQGFQHTSESVSTMLTGHTGALHQVEATLREVNSTLSGLASRLDPTRLPSGEWEKLASALGDLTASMHKLQVPQSDLTTRMEAAVGTLSALANDGRRVAPVPDDARGAPAVAMAQINRQLEQPFAALQAELRQVSEHLRNLHHTLASRSTRRPTRLERFLLLGRE